MKENPKNKYRILPEEEKEPKQECERNRYRNMTEDKKTSWKSIKDNVKQQIIFFLHSIKMSDKALKGGVLKLIRKNFMFLSNQFL